MLDSAQAVSEIRHLPFYGGWTAVHTDWEPLSVSYEEFLEYGTSAVAQTYFSLWTSPILSFVIFGLFGVTKEARASYWRGFCWITLKLFGWQPAEKHGFGITTINFGRHHGQEDAEIGYLSRFVRNRGHSSSFL